MANSIVVSWEKDLIKSSLLKISLLLVSKNLGIKFSSPYLSKDPSWNSKVNLLGNNLIFLNPK